MKTLQLLTLALFISLTSLTNAQEKQNDATIDETQSWINQYGSELTISPNKSRVPKSYSEFEIREMRFYRIVGNIRNGSGFSSASEYVEASIEDTYKILISKSLANLYDIKLFFKDVACLKRANGKDNIEDAIMNLAYSDCIKTNEMRISFEDKKKALRFLKALTHFMKMNNFNVEVKNNLVNENKF